MKVTVVLLMLVLGGFACSGQKRKMERHTFTVIGKVTLNGEPIPHDHVGSFGVKWRSWMYNLWPTDSPGEFRGSFEHTFLGEWHVPPTNEVADIKLAGSTFPTFRSGRENRRQDPFKSRLIDDYTLLIEIDLKGPEETFEMTYVDERGHPIPGARLTVSVDAGQGATGPRRVTTDDNGRFTLSRIRFPFTYFGVEERDMDPRRWMLEPDWHRPGTVEFPDQDARIVRRALDPNEAVFADSEFAKAVARETEEGRLAFMLTPLERPTRPFRRQWSFGTGLDSEARYELADHSRIWLGDVPDRRQYLTIFTPATGIWAAPTAPLWSGSKLKIDSRLGVRDEAIHAQVVHPGGKNEPAAGALVLDACVPHNAVPAIIQVLGRVEEKSGPGWTCADRSGRFKLTRAHRGEASGSLLTIVTSEGKVFHVAEPQDDDTISLANHADDGQLRITVLDPDGDPLAGVAVHLTSIDTSTDDTYVDWPSAHEMTTLNETDKQGRVVVTGILPADYILALSHALRDQGDKRTFRVDPGSIRVVTVRPGDNPIRIMVSTAMLEEILQCDHPDHNHSHDHEDDEGRDHRD